MLKGKSKYIGQIVDVRFLRNRNGLAATSGEFEKIAFIDKYSINPSQPQAGEYWQCRVRGDSKPKDPQRGALFVEPLALIEEETRWLVVSQTPNGELGHYKPKIQMRVTFGKQVRIEKQWSPASPDEIDASWPDWVQRNAREMFKRFERARKTMLCRLRARDLAEIKKSHQLSDPVERLRDGSTKLEFRFQWVRDWLTNGELWLPRAYPAPNEWRRYSIPRVPLELWDEFLEGLEGKFLEELIPFHKRCVEKRSMANSLTRRQKEIKRLVETRMWSGNRDCERLSIGVNVIFIVKRSDKKPIYLVDNPGVGAIYVFDDYERARLLATGSLTRREAIELGIKRICHSKGWEDRLTSQLM